MKALRYILVSIVVVMGFSIVLMVIELASLFF
jgi:hypothetical protein